LATAEFCTVPAALARTSIAADAELPAPTVPNEQVTRCPTVEHAPAGVADRTVTVEGSSSATDTDVASLRPALVTVIE
jgi:hypothetical protein